MADQENANAIAAVLAAASLSDEAFVDYVRTTEARRPEIMNMIHWRDGIRREIDMRLLLRGK
jgi:hypothetical protein